MKNSNILAQTAFLIDQAAEKLSIEPEMLSVLNTPYREVTVDLPVRDMTGTLNIYKAFRVQHNGARGPYYGGVALGCDLNKNIVRSLAKRTALKTALMNIPFGGAYGGIAVDPNVVDSSVLEACTRKYTDKLTALIGPYKDILSAGQLVNEKIMACIMDEYSKKATYSQAVAVGKPEILGGTIGRKIALVSSAYYLLDIVAKNMQTQLPGLSMALSCDWTQAISFIDYVDYLGCNLLSLCVDDRCLFGLESTDHADLKAYLLQNNSLEGYEGAEQSSLNTFLSQDVDVLFLGSDNTIIDSSNASQINAQMLVELMDGLIDLDAEEILFGKDVTVIPDLLVTSGTSIIDYFEWIQNIQQFKWSDEQINEEMANHINEAFKQVSEYSLTYQVSYRVACYMLGLARLAEATSLRGYA